MKILSLQAFVPSGPDFDKAKRFFIELGFDPTWDGGNMAGFEKDGFGFILQHYDNPEFAQNLMLSVRITDVKKFSDDLREKNLGERFAARIGNITSQPYGMEVTVLDPAGVCWHFIQ